MKKTLGIVLTTSLLISALALPAFADTTTTGAAAPKKIYAGFGEISNYRASKDNVNLTTASVIFDEDGKILNLNWDVMEITKTLFPGWPVDAAPAPTTYTVVSGDVFSKIAWDNGLTIDDLAKLNPQVKDINVIFPGDKIVVKAAAAATTSNKAAFQATVDFKWETKKEEGDSYGMKAAAISGKEWWQQMDVYEKLFVGKTVAEVEAWVNKYTNPVDKRPYKLAYLNNAKISAADKAAAEKASANFTDAEKAMLVDVTTGATMSLEDDHSKFITALKEAWAAKKEVNY